MYKKRKVVKKKTLYKQNNKNTLDTQTYRQNDHHQQMLTQ